MNNYSHGVPLKPNLFLEAPTTGASKDQGLRRGTMKWKYGSCGTQPTPDIARDINAATNLSLICSVHVIQASDLNDDKSTAGTKRAA